jgi:hypothetical protein
MRILCDHHVAPKYVRAFEREPWITVTIVEEVLEKDAPDPKISSVARSENWVVFTNDTDFYRLGVDHGLLVYSQLEDPSPGDVIDATQKIDDAYTSREEISEFVPGRWIEFP